MRVLITGGLGFIGSNFIRHLLTHYQGYRIINLDAVTYAGRLENLKDVEDNPRYLFVEGDIADDRLVESIICQEGYGPIEGIINVAAETHVDRSIWGPSVFVRTNVLGTQNLLEATRKYIASGGGNGRLRFLQVSSDEVYGSLDGCGRFLEDSPLKPNSPYSASKASADLLCRAYFQTYGMPILVTRCSNNYGPYQHPEKFIPLAITNAMQDKPIPVYGDGLNVRDWLYVEDHCCALASVFERGASGEVYNIAAQNEYTNIEIARLILAELGKREDLIAFVPDRPGHDRRYALDTSKIRDGLGWRPRTEFMAGLKDTIRWYSEHESWVRNVLTVGQHAPSQWSWHS